jgi:RNA polymerase sigma-70 factor (ECF subfamily)
MTAAQPEVELARRLSQGDREALAEFTQLFQRKVYQYSYLMCGQREDAEEVAQDTLLRVVERFDQLRRPEYVRAWVFQIAKNVCMLKRRKSIFAPTEELPLDAHAAEVADHAPPPDLQAILRESIDRLREAIRELPDTFRAVLLLRDLEELSTHETATILGISEDLVKTRLHRARLALRTRLAAQ